MSPQVAAEISRIARATADQGGTPVADWQWLRSNGNAAVDQFWKELELARSTPKTPSPIEAALQGHVDGVASGKCSNIDWQYCRCCAHIPGSLAALKTRR